MSLTFAIEPLSAVWNEWLELAALQWQETEGYRHNEVMNPSFNRYDQYEKMGCFLMFTARDGERLVGSCGVYLVPSMHTQMPLACEDTLFLRKEYRRGRNADEFLDWGEKELAKRGATRIDVSSKFVDRLNKKTKKIESVPSTGLLLERRGYTKIGMQYSKPLVPGRQPSKPETPV